MATIETKQGQLWQWCAEDDETDTSYYSAREMLESVIETLGKLEFLELADPSISEFELPKIPGVQNTTDLLSMPGMQNISDWLDLLLSISEDSEQTLLSRLEDRNTVFAVTTQQST